MKIQFLILYAATLLAGASVIGAEEPKSASTGSPEFERMKTLVGSWTGKVDMGQGPVDMTLTYRLLAGGSVLEERVFAGTTNEMITMYYDRDGRLAATHYCVFGNRPQLRLKSADANSITLDFDKACGINVKKESHMHTMKIVFNDPNTITTSCRSFINGKEQPECATTLKRVQE